MKVIPYYLVLGTWAILAGLLLFISSFTIFSNNAYSESNIVILEVEPNPAGTDAGNEWVRLFNPSSNSINLSGWQISSTHGNTNTHTLSGNIGACDDIKIIFPSQFIDNEDELLILYDNAGNVVDSTPIIYDTSNDGSTWKITTPSCDSSQPEPEATPEPEPEYLDNGCPVGYPYIWSDGYCYSVPEPVPTPKSTTPEPYKQSGDTYYVYADEIPSWGDHAGSAVYDATEFWKDNNDWLNFYEASNSATANIHIKWVKEFGTETVGQAVDQWFVEVGLGDSVCYEHWQPFSANYVTYITTHEIGHVLGLEHSDDPDSIMYPIVNNLEYGVVEQEYTLTENYGQFIGLCTIKPVTTLEYWVSSDDPTYGFDVYVVPSVDSFYDWGDGKSFKYYSNEGCSEKNFISFGGTCKGIYKGSGLLVIMNSELTNPLTTLTVRMQELANTGSSQAKIALEEPDLFEVPTVSPSTDSDYDGIMDDVDNCPFQPETWNGYLDFDGCPDTQPIVIPKQESESEYKDRASFSKSTYKTKIDELKSGIETAENSLLGLEYESPDAQKKIEQAWEIRGSALEKLVQANVKWEIGDYEIDKQNFRTAIINFKGIDADSELIGTYLKLITASLGDAEKLEEEYQSQKKSETQPQEEQKTSNGGGCLIATATYGSELAPQVQQLREIRDNSLLQTQSGQAFMQGFNQFYYSFSPTIADWERENPVFKKTVKLAITPLLTSLSILNYVNIDSEAEMLGYGISLIVLNVGMYFVLPAIVIQKFGLRLFSSAYSSYKSLKFSKHSGHSCFSITN